MSDPRFARLKTDPRFRRPKKHQSKVVVDERFKSVFEPKKSKGKKSVTGRVDKYGRSLAETHEEDNLKRFYRLENQNDDDEASKAPDFARGGVLMESSDEEDGEDKKDEDDSDVDGFVTVGHDPSRPIPVANDEAEIDLDEDDFADLDAQAAAYSKAHPEERSEEAERTNRLAIVNLDWEHVRAVHLFKICSSLVSPTAPLLPASASSSQNTKAKGKAPTKGTTIARGRVFSVKVYPSQFGKERMAREETEGPPPEVFGRRQVAEGEEVNEKNIYEVGDGNDFDEDALRKYQLERLRYYYAIVTCDTVDAASHIYNELEGTELERSANIFDISFVPNDMTFDEEPRDEATEDAETGYKAVEFVTDALRHSKVKLTWDEDDPERNKVTRRNITRKELEEADFRNYIASASSESEAETDGPKKSGLNRDKLRSLLLGGDNELPEGWDKGKDKDEDLDMEVTFTPGLADGKDEEDETTLERYQRKMKEKRKKRKEESKKKPEVPKIEDDFFDAASEDEESASKPSDAQSHRGGRNKSTDEELSLLVGTDGPSHEPQHFNLKAIMKAERKQKKKKGKKVAEEENEMQEDFTIDVKDDRFKAIHEDYNFAIDPTNPQFKKTQAMEALLNERSQRKAGHSGNSAATEEDSLKNLAERVKRKGTSSRAPGKTKRQRVI
ncbi:pre-rRNA-processing protein esf1 [Paramarasmius palmivorus]|uniref:Pre-rRNA-processing protein esf1 n=1 Tax=Paramarasmius palmivorus TaxID=297713 RepID=A0AAW0E6S2_9AGAR